MIATDDDILASAEAWKRAGRGVALATVVETWGSAPRPVGSHLVVDREGNFLGSVSGGCVEGDVVTEAVDVIGTGAPRRSNSGSPTRRRGASACPAAGRSGSMWSGSTDAPRLLSRPECRAGGTARCRAGHGSRAGEQTPCRRGRWPPIPWPSRSRRRLRMGKSGAVGADGRSVFLPCRSRRCGSGASGPCTSARPWRRWPASPGSTSRSSIRAPPSRRRNAFPTYALLAEWPDEAFADSASTGSRPWRR